MPTHCNPALFEFEPVDGRAVVAAFGRAHALLAKAAG